MPRYDFRCRSCGATFELTRSMSESGAQAECPSGHADTVKLLSTVAVTGRTSPGAASSGAAAAGGCCGGACGCG